MLNKLIILIDLIEVQEPLSGLARRLRETGISVARLQEEELGKALEKETLADTLFLIERKRDCDRILAAGGYVILYLHEGNRTESFAAVRYALEGFEGVDGGYLDLVYRRFRGLPWIITDTDRCQIREFTEADLESLKQIFSSPEARRYLDVSESAEAEETARISVRTYIDRIYGFYGYGIWLILDKRTQEPVGCAGFSMRPGFSDPEFGFIIREEWQRQGYAGEVCRALLDFAGRELGFERVRALVRRENKASAGLCRKLGFVKSGEDEVSGGVCDRYELELIRGE